MANTHISISDRKVFLKKIGTRKTGRKYGNNDAIFTQGDVADSMFGCWQALESRQRRNPQF
jgi:hypothetical protein